MQYLITLRVLSSPIIIQAGQSILRCTIGKQQDNSRVPEKSSALNCLIMSFSTDQVISAFWRAEFCDHVLTVLSNTGAPTVPAARPTRAEVGIKRSKQQAQS